MTTREPFTPTAVLIPESAAWEDGRGEHVYPEDCTPLHLESDDNCGWLYTREEWESGAESKIYRRYGRCEGTDQRIELLPNMVIVKLTERDYWIDPWILDRTKEIYSVFAIDRRKHVHICSFSANYEAYFLSTQWDEVDDLPEDEHEELWERITSVENEQYSYFDVYDIDMVLENPCRCGWTPANGQSGGYSIDVGSVTTDDAYLELEEDHRGSEL